MLKVAITGSTGLVGSRIQELLYHDFEFIPLLHRQVDFTNRTELNKHLDKIDFDFLLHLAGYTNVDKAQSEQKLAYTINVEGTRNLFEAAQKKNANFIYFSTDFVFDGTHPPYDEFSPPNPLSVYGQTKYQGEKVLKGKAVIIRIAYPYRSAFAKKTDFVRTIYSLLSQGKKIKMMTDCFFTPTFIDDIAYALKYLLTNYSAQTYHLVGSKSLSPYEAAKIIAARCGLDEALVQPTTFAEYSKGRAPRPKYSEIKSIKNNFQKMSSLQEGLEKLVL